MLTNRDLLKSEELALLIARARAVTDPHVFGDNRYAMSARHVATELEPLVRRLANVYGLGEMRQTCAWLAGRPWPTGPIGCSLRDPIMALAKALAHRAGQLNVRDALAFWASETDPAVWQQVVVGAASNQSWN